MTTNDYTPEWWEGEGYYSVKGASHGAETYTNDGPEWLEDESELAELYAWACAVAEETNPPYVEYEGMGYEVHVCPCKLEWVDGFWAEEAVSVASSSRDRQFVRLEDAKEYVFGFAESWDDGGEYSVKKLHGKFMPPTYSYEEAYIISVETGEAVEGDGCFACSLPDFADPRNC